MKDKQLTRSTATGSRGTGLWPSWRQKSPLPQHPHHGTLPEAVLSWRAGDRLMRWAQARARGPQDDDDDVDPAMDEASSEAPDIPEAPAEVPEDRLSAASSQRQPLPQQPHHGTFPDSRSVLLSLRMEDSRRLPVALHADTRESLEEALLVRSLSDAVVVWSAGRMASVGEGARRGFRLRMDTRRLRSDLLGDSWPEDDDCDTSAACGLPAWPGCLEGVPGVAVEPLDETAPGVLGSPCACAFCLAMRLREDGEGASALPLVTGSSRLCAELCFLRSRLPWGARRDGAGEAAGLAGSERRLLGASSRDSMV